MKTTKILKQRAGRVRDATKILKQRVGLIASRTLHNMELNNEFALVAIVLQERQYDYKLRLVVQ